MPRAARPEFHPIGSYGFLADCQTAALIAPDGAVEWLCLPRFDSPSVFGAILDRGAGAFRFAPRDIRVPVATRYIPGTNVLETTWMTENGGWLAVHDALILPQEGEPQGMLVRTATCTWEKVDVALSCEPMLDYGAELPDWRQDRDGGWATEVPDLEQPLRLRADMPLELEGECVVGRRTLSKGESCFCVLTWGEVEPPREHGDAAGRLDATVGYWRQWMESGRFPDHPWRIYLQRSALALKGLVYEPTGAIVAAATTSLPETPGGERNWDYRYTWIRDATFALWGLHILGFDDEAVAFMRFVANMCRQEGPDLQIMFGINGERDLSERELPHLNGYMGARPVRVGNAAWDQRQNDVFGALLDSVYIHTRARKIDLPEGFWEVIRDQVEGAVAAWRNPDRGIWEVRGEPRHFLSSKLMCWVALDRGVRLAQSRGEEENASRWQLEADELRAEILARGVSERGVFRQHYDTDALDASTLLIPLVRFLPPDDERVCKTVLAIADELTEQGLVLRYRTHETDDGLKGVEGTFTICTFWLVSALSEIGERDRARDLCEHVISHASALGLYAEELDATTGAHLGNFPQAFTHLALINAVAHVISDDQRGERGRTAVFSEMRSGGDEEGA